MSMFVMRKTITWRAVAEIDFLCSQQSKVQLDFLCLFLTDVTLETGHLKFCMWSLQEECKECMKALFCSCLVPFGQFRKREKLRVKQICSPQLHCLQLTKLSSSSNASDCEVYLSLEDTEHSDRQDKAMYGI